MATEDIHDVWDSDREHEALLAIFVLWYGTMLKAVHTLTLLYLNLGPVPLDDPAVKRAILEARGAAIQVDNQTRKMIAQRIAEGAQRGLTAEEIAYGTEDFPGIEGLFTETWKSRPLTVARTELQRAQLTASVDRYRQLGKGVINALYVSDGDHDAFCAGRNGTIVPINQPPSLAHPNCRLTVSPVSI